MTTDSRRADLDLMIGYDLAQSGRDYTAIALMKLNAEGVPEVLGEALGENLSISREDVVSRETLLSFCLLAIRTLRPRRVSVRVGENDAIVISNQTVEEILAGTKDVKDLMIGS